MEILLDEFEPQIDETILKRGFDYFKETLLGALPHDALKAFMHEACMNDRKFCQLFVAKHIPNRSALRDELDKI